MIRLFEGTVRYAYVTHVIVSSGSPKSINVYHIIDSDHLVFFIAWVHNYKAPHSFSDYKKYFIFCSLFIKNVLSISRLDETLSYKQKFTANNIFQQQSASSRPTARYGITVYKKFI